MLPIQGTLAGGSATYWYKLRPETLYDLRFRFALHRHIQRVEAARMNIHPSKWPVKKATPQ
jgi:hypothetical protein